MKKILSLIITFSLFSALLSSCSLIESNNNKTDITVLQQSDTQISKTQIDKTTHLADATQTTGNTSSSSNPTKALFVDDDMATMLSSVERVDKDGYLYELNYTYDYYDELITAILALVGLIDSGCSAFTTYSTTNDFLFCRNYDYKHPDKNGNPTGLNTIIKTNAKGKLKTIGICDCYWLNTDSYFAGALDNGKTNLSNMAVAPYMCVDGMNEAGVSCALFALDTKPGESLVNQNTGKERIMFTVLLRYILDNAHSIDEAIQIAEKYDIYSINNTDLHLMVSDKNGESAVLEWRKYGNDTEQKLYVTYTNAVTNFFVGFDDAQDMYYQSGNVREKFTKVTGTENTYHYGYGIGYHRFNGIVSALDRYVNKNPKVNSHGVKNSTMLQSQAVNILSVAAQDPGAEKTSFTQYSAIYNLTKKSLSVYSCRDYSASFDFSL